jgi:hypothetical protein
MVSTLFPVTPAKGQTMKPIEALEADTGKLHHREYSATAASVTDRKFPNSGVIRYLVVIQNGDVRTGKVVEAATGDEAAAKALTLNGGGKVAYVGPASDGVDTARLSDNNVDEGCWARPWAFWLCV